MLVLLPTNFVKKPRRSSAMPVFFASLPNKITSPDSENLFRNKPLVKNSELLDFPHPDFLKQVSAIIFSILLTFSHFFLVKR